MKVKILNLDSRPDRWANVQQECVKFGITEFERFPAFTGGVSGFNKSMKTILQGEQELLILEDDCQFHGHIDQLLHYKTLLPDDWGLLYLGANVRSEQRKYVDGIWHLNNAWTTHAILYSNLGAKYCAKEYDEKLIYDEWLRTHTQKVLKCFIVNPFLATQRSDKSDIWGADADYDLKETEKYLK